MTSKRFIYFILAVFIAGNLLLVFVQYNSAKNIEYLTEENEKLLDELKINNELREMERDLLAAEKKIRGSVALNNVTYLNEVDGEIFEAKAFLDSLKKISIGGTSANDIDKLMALADEKLALKSLIMSSYARTGNLLSDSLKNIFEHRMLSTDVNDLSRDIYNSRRDELDRLTFSVSSAGRKARLWGNVMILMVLVSGALLFWYIINRIMRQNQLITQLDISEKKLRELSLIKEKFLANMSHEIRTPMNAILGFSRLLQSKNKNPELTEFIGSIMKSGENLITIINDILDLSKIEAGMLRIESASFNIREVVHSVYAMFGEKISERGLHFALTIDESIPEILIGDANRLTQILVNMIGNGIKFTPEGTIKVDLVNKGLSENVIKLKFIISDTGIGIAQDKLPGIFDRFSQAEDATTRKYGGTGLGLSIVKELVSLQQGELNVKSEVGKGTSFTFTIPYEIGENQEAFRAIDETDRIKINAAGDLRILVVEDNELNQNLIKHLLKEWQCSFDVVNNGKEAIESLRSTDYQIVLMDIQMPLMDGYAAAREIRSTLKLNTPIIALTAHSFPGEREKCLSHGMNEYISKPINEKELLEVIMRSTHPVGKQTRAEKNVSVPKPAAYRFISLEYLYDISMGNIEYEKEATQQFIEAVPDDLRKLESAYNNKDLNSLQQTAHDMKTNVSVMGLTGKLQPLLDLVEYESLDEISLQQAIQSIRTICLSSLPEAMHFYATLCTEPRDL